MIILHVRQTTANIKYTLIRIFEDLASIFNQQDLNSLGTIHYPFIYSKNIVLSVDRPDDGIKEGENVVPTV